MPLGHIGINVGDLAAAKPYYDELMALVSYVPFFATEDQFAYMPADQKPGTWVFFYAAQEPADYSRHRPGLQHLAFIVRTRAAVLRVHEWAQAKGAEILYPPQEFPHYHEGYFATFWLDPHGFMLEVVCHREPEPDAGAS